MLRSRRLARSLARKRTLPQRMLRELRWLWRDVKDLHGELTRWGDEQIAGTPKPLAAKRQSEMNDPRDRSDGDW